MIAGGGIAGLEAMLALSELAGGLVDVELVSPSDEFLYRPMLVAEPFGRADALRLDLGTIAAEAGARHVMDSLGSVDPAAREVNTTGGKTLRYDALLVALGARPVEAVPGALTFAGNAERGRFAELLAGFGSRGKQRLAFVVPREATWSVAAYELALLTAGERDARSLHGTEITLVTHEPAPLSLFGAAASQLVTARLDEAGIALWLSSTAHRFEAGGLRVDDGGLLEADEVVALPALEVPPLPGLPQRDRGFVQTDVQMHVAGLEAVWAAGDATAFPVKQGGLAAQQADAAARSIAARAGAHVPVEPFQPVLRAVMITGEAPAFLRSSLPSRGAEVAVGRPLWWPPTKVAGTYLGPYIAGALGEQPSQRLVDAQSPTSEAMEDAEHAQAIGLLLAAADADARAGDYEGAIQWLWMVERLNVVIPAEYVTRRDEWRRRLDPEASPGAAALRFDPGLEGAAAAISDLQRRLGWLREIDDRTEADMRAHLSDLDRGMEQLLTLSRRAGILKGREHGSA